MSTPSDFAIRGLTQSILGGSTAIEETFLLNELARRLILNGMTVSASGVITLGPFSFTPSSPWTIANGGTNSATALSGSSIMISNGSAIVQGTLGTTTTVLHGNAAGAPTYSAVVEADMSFSDVTTGNVTSASHGFTPKSPGNAAQFLNGAATPAFAAVKDSDLATTDVTTNNVSTSKHGFQPKLPNVATQFQDGTGVYRAVTNADVTDTTTTLADGATPALDASLGHHFRLAAAGDRTIAVPTNPTAGRKITIEHFASAGIRTLALNTGAGGFRFGTDITALTATASGKTDYIGCIYNSTDAKWDVVAVTKGF